MNDTKLHTLIGTYTDYVHNLRSKIQLNKDSPAKQARRMRHLAVLELKLGRSIDEMERRNDRRYPLR